jgi:L-asparaginase II
MDAISVAVSRGSFVESVHEVHAVVVQDGAVVAEAGDPALVTSMRSAAKPFQALQLVRARDDLDDRDVAIASASHNADPEQIEAVRRLLARAPASEPDLELGIQAGRPPAPIFHNCSGKHAGMLATCRASGWETSGYRLAGHPLQQAIVNEVAEAAGVRSDELQTAVDGCGVVCFALPLERVAFMFSRLEARDGGARVAAAMRACPRLVGGEGKPDTDLMESLPGWIAKGGAEGLLCAAGPGGIGVAVKSGDGSFRPLRAALPLVLEQIGVDASAQFGATPVVNSRGEQVGEVVARS